MPQWGITVRAAADQVDPVMDFINEQLAEAGCPEEARIDIDVAVDELMGNIIRYAYGPEAGPVTVQAETEKDPPAVVITLMDRGKPFNPLAQEMPDTTALPAGKRPIGGLGLFMVRNLMDEMTYKYRDGQNILTIRKNL